MTSTSYHSAFFLREFLAQATRLSSNGCWGKAQVSGLQGRLFNAVELRGPVSLEGECGGVA